MSGPGQGRWPARGRVASGTAAGLIAWVMAWLMALFVALFVAASPAQAQDNDSAPKPAAGGDAPAWLKALGDKLGDAAREVGNATTAHINGTTRIRGYVLLQRYRVLTCFEGISGGYLSPGNVPISSPAQGRAAVITDVTASGKLITGLCDTLAADGDLLPPPGQALAGVANAPATAAGVPRQKVAVQELDLGNGHALVNDEYNCMKVYHRLPDGTRREIEGRSNNYFAIAARCETETNEQAFARIKPAGAKPGAPAPEAKAGAGKPAAGSGSGR